jgi:hypothetical protein
VFSLPGLSASSDQPPRTADPSTGKDPGLEELVEGFDEDDATQTMDSLMDGFEDDAPEPEEQSKAAQRSNSSWLSIDGDLKFGASWNYAHQAPEPGQPDWQGVSRLRPEAALEVDIKLPKEWELFAGARYFYDSVYAVKGRENYSDEFLDAYEEEFEWSEVYLQGPLGKYMDLKAGRQIAVWGRSDNIRVTDILNPLDMREPGMTDIEDLRLPITMTRLDGYWRAWNLSAMALHEIRFGKYPVYGSDFYPATSPLPEETVPCWGDGNTEWALALNGVFSGKDISFYWAEVFNEEPYVVLGPDFKITREYARVNMWGMAGNLAWGNWLLKGEIAYWTGLRFFYGGDRSFNRVDGLVGWEYSGWREATVALEFAVRHIMDYDERLAARPDYTEEEEYQWALRYMKDFANDTVHLMVMASLFGPAGQGAAFERATITYDWTDAISLTAGAVFYQSGDEYVYSSFEDNDRIFGEIKYSF